MDKKAEEFYERLKNELDQSNTWPTLYLFKFIVPSVNDNVEKVENAFDRLGAVIKTNQSKTGKFTSVSIDVMMESSQQIIDKYLELTTIEGIISL
ncbi:MAG: hypothetical protein QG594_1085 [Bacteroidota bacterium]|jgi:putative lipoic acid-binding regulatory protein|nr:hypothetical protein [Bacteroidota bacterium]